MAKKAYIGINGVARAVKKGYIGVPTETVPDGEPVVTNLYNKNGVIDVDYQGAARSDLVYKNSDGTVTIKSNYNTLVYGQNLYGVVKEGYAYTFACDIISSTIGQVHIAMDCMKDGARYIEYEGTTSAVAGTKIARTFIVPSGCTSIVFGIAIPSVDASQYVVVNNIKVLQGAYTADNLPTAVYSVAQKLKKAYIGIGGVARPCWSGGGELAYYGTTTALNVARADIAATTVGNYALFAGGYDNGDSYGYTNCVDVYDTSLTHQIKYLKEDKCSAGAATVGNYALFVGGEVYYDPDYGAIEVSATYDAFNSSLTRTNGSSPAVSALVATTVGNYALFGGGDLGGSHTNKIYSYDASLTRKSLTSLTGYGGVTATTLGNYALFCGGDTSEAVDTYNTSCTKGTAPSLSAKRRMMAATAVGNYALIAGGQASANSAVVDAYNTSLTRTTATSLSVARRMAHATTVGDYAIFAGGLGNSVLSVVDVYDSSLTRTTGTSLSASKYSGAAATVGNYALFAGGRSSSLFSPVVDVYTIV